MGRLDAPRQVPQAHAEDFLRGPAGVLLCAIFASATWAGCADPGSLAGGGAFGGGMMAAAPAADAGNAAPTSGLQGNLMQSLVAAQLAARQAQAPAQANADASEPSALHDAARDCDVARLNQLLDAGGNVDARLRGTGDQVSEGMTPLMTAAKSDQLDCVRLLLARGARVDAQSRWGWTAENYADHFHASADVRAMLHNAYLEAHPETAAAPATPAAAADAPVAAAPSAPAAPVSDADATGPRAAERPHDYALVIGIEKYSRVPDARFAEHDADAMKNHLIALGYPERNIILLKGGHATRGEVQGYVEEWLPRNVGPQSEVFVYFSGHGSPDPKNGDAYLVPWDGDPMFLKSTAYPLKSLYASLGKLNARRVLIALDSCFSGAGGRSVLADGARPLVSRVDTTAAPARVTVLSAASGDEITGTIDSQGHGAFTYYLLKSLNDGKLTARAAYRELKPRVEDEAHRQNREQTPLLLGADAPF